MLHRRRRFGRSRSSSRVRAIGDAECAPREASEMGRGQFVVGRNTVHIYQSLISSPFFGLGMHAVHSIEFIEFLSLLS